MKMEKQVKFDPWPHLFANPLVTYHTHPISTTIYLVKNRDHYFPLDQVDPTQICTMSKPNKLQEIIAYNDKPTFIPQSSVVRSYLMTLDVFMAW